MRRPDRGGHSVVVVMLETREGSQSPFERPGVHELAAALRDLPERQVADRHGSKPVSSRNSRIAVSSGSSPAWMPPLGIVHAPSCRPVQKGPPGCASNTSMRPSRRRNSSRPALSFCAMSCRNVTTISTRCCFTPVCEQATGSDLRGKSHEALLCSPLRASRARVAGRQIDGIPPRPARLDSPLLFFTPFMSFRPFTPRV